MTLMSKPHRSVITKASFKKGELILVPHTNRITVYPTIDKLPAGALHVNFSETIVGLLPEYNEKHFLMPAWALHTTTDETEVNMKLSYETVIVPKPSWPVSIMSSVGKKGAGSDGSAPKPYKFGIPVFINTVKVEKNVELKVYRQAPEAIKQKKAPLVVGKEKVPAAKKQKM